MRRRVHFHGYLKQLVPDVIEIDAVDVADAIDGATRQLPQLAPDAVRGRHRITVVGCPTFEDLKRTDLEDIHIMPQLSGGKEGGVFQIVVGLTLIAVGFATGNPFAAEQGFATLMVTMGASMVLGGVMQLLMPTPKRDQAQGDPEASKYLGAPGNTTAIGTRIPILYGRDKVFGHYISFDVDAKDVAV